MPGKRAPTSELVGYTENTLFSQWGARLKAGDSRRSIRERISGFGPAPCGQRTGPSHEIPTTANPLGESRTLSLAPRLDSTSSQLFWAWGTHMRGCSENRTGEGVALTPVRPRSACKVRLRGLHGSASFRRLRNRSARLPRHEARSGPPFHRPSGRGSST